MKLVLTLLTVALLAPAAAGASELRPTSSELESELVCPVCDTTLDTSDAPAARRMKAFIRARIAAGDTKSEIKAKLVADFGPTVLAVPPRQGFDWIAWLLPLFGIALGLVIVATLAWRWSRRGDDEPPRGDDEPLDPAMTRRVYEALERFEG